MSIYKRIIVMNFFDKIVIILSFDLDVDNKNDRPRRFTTRTVGFSLFLLLAPDLHNESVRQKLCK